MFKNKNKNKKIIFEEGNSFAKHLLDQPKPSTNSVPEWFKKQKLFSTGKNDEFDMVKYGGVATYKRCIPVTDSITAGYNILLPATIYVINVGTPDNYIPQIKWQVEWDICDSREQEVLGNYPIPTGHNSSFFRWTVNWKIVTPKGYSIWVTHPSHRYDLPFTTINGFVDSDLHPNTLLLPFFIKEGFEGKIDAGTPIAQIIPIKRESWISKRKDLEESTSVVKNNNIKLLFSQVYKQLYWSKKKYM